jgi:uracil-DNA glycosylase family 4
MQIDQSLAKIEQEVIACRKCPRLVAWREEVAAIKRRAYRDQDYWGKPVPGFGDPAAKLLAYGLAPGAHGSNRTGRMFTGDASGDFLYPALFRYGFANQPTASDRFDSMELKGLFISAAVRCAPPDNKPTREEIQTCLPWTSLELGQLKALQGVVVLGRIAFDSLLSLPEFQLVKPRKLQFGHGLFHDPGEGLPWLLCSYHPSRQNTQTGCLTVEMFDAIWQKAHELLI